MSVPYFEGPSLDEIRENLDRMYGSGDVQFGITAAPQGDGGGGGGGGDAGPTAEDRYWDWRQTQDKLDIKQAQDSLISQISGLFSEYGLSSLYSKVVEYVKAGYSGDAIAIMLRQTPEYKERFPAMAALSSKGRSLSEAEYIAFERNASRLERAYGLPEGMLGKDAVTGLLTNEVSGDELEDRVVMAAAGAFQASQEVKDTFAQYYGIDAGGLTAYFLDPEKALPLLTKQYVSSQIGAAGAMQDVVVASNTAEDLYQMGVTQEQARAGFGNVARQGAFTQGRGDVVTQGQLIGSEFGQDAAATAAIERVQRGRIGQFQQGGGYAGSAEGVRGLGSAATR
jgi:hypothetical protein